jgi:hypothetical protein
MTDDEPLDLGETELSDEQARRVRREHDLDRPHEFDAGHAIDERSATRSQLLPEEQASGSDVPEEQAREILRDSDVRTDVPESAPDTMMERRKPEETL